MNFPADPSCVRPCRQWVAEVSAAHGATPETLQVVALLTSELFTNAVKYGPPGGPVDVTIDVHDEVLHVAVQDAGTELPVVVVNPPPSAPGGRGMRLVQLLSRAWGVDRLAHGGKAVWFEVPVVTAAV